MPLDETKLEKLIETMQFLVEELRLTQTYRESVQNYVDSRCARVDEAIQAHTAWINKVISTLSNEHNDCLTRIQEWNRMQIREWSVSERDLEFKERQTRAIEKMAESQSEGDRWKRKKED